ncbi:MAG: hypothetical protein U1F26_12205 [Lysobacterales bacterium]
MAEVRCRRLSRQSIAALALLGPVLLPSCALVPAEPSSAYTLCSVDESKWALRAAPANASSLVRDMRVKEGDEVLWSRSRLYWFGNAADELLLCRAGIPNQDLRDRCDSRLWRFHRSGEEWVRDELEYMVICG